MTSEIREAIQQILDHYRDTPPGTAWSRSHPVHMVFADVVARLGAAPPIANRPTLKIDFSGRGRQATLPWIAFLDKRETQSTQHGLYCVYLFREDLSGLYLTLAIGVTAPKRQYGADTAAYRAYLRDHTAEVRLYAEGLTQAGFRLDDSIDLHSTGGLGRDYERATVAHRFYQSGALPDEGVLIRDLEAVLKVYDRYLQGHYSQDVPSQPPEEAISDQSKTAGVDAQHFDFEEAIAGLINYIAARNYIFEPWQIAAYVAAARTKPFVILAGVTGTGKSTLPRLVAEATGGQAQLVPVRPDWTDSADVLGYLDLQGHFRPGVLLQLAKKAMDQTDQHWTCVLDEMNLARVEQYLAEVLSRLEDRVMPHARGHASKPLLSFGAPEEWSSVVLPSNLALVGTVNMDESAHGFSRKVLDRAFTLELSDIDLLNWTAATDVPPVAGSTPWPVTAWYPRATMLGGIRDLSYQERESVNRAVTTLVEVNRFLSHAQLQVGYRTRDEVALFVLHSQEFGSAFVTSGAERVDPLDLALHMKVLPRIVGGSAAIRRTLLQLLGWAVNGVPLDDDDDAQSLLTTWESGGRGPLSDAAFPRTASRLCLMWERVANEGFTSFWL